MARKLFGSTSDKENLLGVVIAGGIGGLLPVAIRRLVKLNDTELASRKEKFDEAAAASTPTAPVAMKLDYEGRWKDVIRNHASAIGAAGVAAAAGVAYAMKKPALSKTIGIVGAVVVAPRLIQDYTLPKEDKAQLALQTDLGARTRLGVVTAEELRGASGAPVRFLGRGLGVYTAQELRGTRPQSGVVRVLGGAYGANPISMAHVT